VFVDFVLAAIFLFGERFKSCFKIMLAAFLSNGWFSFPHFGEYMHEGQPSLHSQFSISSSVFSHRDLIFEQSVSEMPMPPSKPL
jgi:hypothetical protein